MDNKKEKDIEEMVETAKYLAENDPQSLLIAKAGMDMLKVRCDLAKSKESTT